ncbi:MAG: site-specific integrase, partial [Actinomycetota bacterium]|nr:site-specific integrase [Actinomycetota bacterium]
MASISKRTIRWRTREGEDRTGERYEAFYRDRAGNRHRRLFELKRDAQRWLDEQTAGLVTGQWADPRAGRESLRDFAERWRKRQVHSPNTATAFESVLRLHVYPTLGTHRLDEIRPPDVQGLVRLWANAAAPTTVENRYTILATVLRGAANDRAIPASPCQDVKLPRVEPRSALVPIATEVVLALYDAMPARYRAFVLVGAGTGMRRAEILGLTLDRVSTDFSTIRVDRQLARSSTSTSVTFGVPKTKASVRTIGVAPFVMEAISAHVAQFGTHSTGLLFTSGVGSAVAPSVLHRAWSIAAAKVGTEATPHALRHY